MGACLRCLIFSNSTLRVKSRPCSPTSMSPRTPISIALVLCMLLSGCIGDEGTLKFEGTAISGPVAGDFTLTDQDGNQVSLRDYSGDVVVVMFIFTRCPNVCPVTTQNLGEVA
ncbi:MAG TPA: SCO family protein, partial [Candidatus Poseidoniales archaeon]|nr:SCO family protein [Candidatus Poseidoniales archaeon]